jgi:hypothetical protein
MQWLQVAVMMMMPLALADDIAKSSTIPGENALNTRQCWKHNPNSLETLSWDLKHWLGNAPPIGRRANPAYYECYGAMFLNSWIMFP